MSVAAGLQRLAMVVDAIETKNVRVSGVQPAIDSETVAEGTFQAMIEVTIPIDESVNDSTRTMQTVPHIIRSSTDSRHAQDADDGASPAEHAPLMPPITMGCRDDGTDQQDDEHAASAAARTNGSTTRTQADMTTETADQTASTDNPSESIVGSSNQMDSDSDPPAASADADHTIQAADEMVPCPATDCSKSFTTTHGMKIHYAKIHDGPAPDPDTADGVPAYRSPERLREVYEEYETFAEMTNALDVDVTSQTVRQYMIDYGIHEPTPSTVTEIEKLATETEFGTARVSPATDGGDQHTQTAGSSERPALYDSSEHDGDDPELTATERGCRDEDPAAQEGDADTTTDQSVAADGEHDSAASTDTRDESAGSSPSEPSKTEPDVAAKLSGEQL